MSEYIFAWGAGLARRSENGTILDCYFPAPLFKLEGALASTVAKHCDVGTQELTPAALLTIAETADGPTSARLRHLADGAATANKTLVSVRLDSDAAIADTATAYLKLHLLSHRLSAPNTLNLDGIFAQLPTIAWTNQGPILAEELQDRITDAQLSGVHLEVQSVDKFPRMVNYVAPDGVRIADASRVRLGAYLGDGTTVMPEGQVNFNAGTVGPNMVEGRISQGVTLGKDTDLGGGASTMGTLSGGNDIRVSLGERCLVGANGGTGIPLGDRCTIEAGLYITGSTPVHLLDENGDEVKIVRARELAGGSDLLFIRNGATGEVQCRTNRNAIALNEALHANN